jgi:hypothetical protein
MDRYAFGVGCWALGVGRWVLGVGCWALGVELFVRTDRWIDWT